MDYQQCYHTCCQYRGQVVRIHDTEGRVHIGRVIDIEEDRVWLQPVSRRSAGGFGYGGRGEFHDAELYAYARGYETGYEEGYYSGAFAVGFAFIIGIAIAALFFF
ncbi:hypothetical protein [Ectobacillus ponti]|uniref:Uncharacterized protein n=1 Tax=Ectobacillus ponti TaxID=2961894 RepID=A0AA41X5P4_9BACI|nr:hypothetical protein [Ectobacillus ponti]MCP8969157.1 hypothetical protein [Ectobacillus ponti]